MTMYYDHGMTTLTELKSKLKLHSKYPFGCRFVYFCEPNGSFGSSMEPTEVEEGHEYYGGKVIGWRDLETGIEGEYKWSN